MSRETAAIVSLSNRSARRRLRASFAPTTSWWWNDTAPPGSSLRVAGLPMSCSSAARRTTRSGESRMPRGDLVVDRLVEHGEGVLVHVLVVVVLVDLEPQRRDLGQHALGEPRVHQQPDAAARRRGAAAASTARRARARPRCGRSRARAPSSRRACPPRPSKPSWAENRAARSIRSGSSPNDCSGAAGVRRVFASRSSTPPDGSTSVSCGSRRASAFTVKSRRARSSSRLEPKTTSGLRESPS